MTNTKSPSAALPRRLLDWYAANRRDLPWRPPVGSKPGSAPDPYYVLVSEAMLQQTQVATVIPYFNRFIARFPTLQSLAGASEQEVLRLWQGLGYYARARNLRKAAATIVNDLKGQFPRDVPGLLSLPGIGPYTAGAIASIAFAQPAPILDGNVARVLTRLDGIEGSPRNPAIAKRLWKRAESLLPQGKLRPLAGDLNSALMELGAKICTPRNPACPACPLRTRCIARAKNSIDRIGVGQSAKPRPGVNRTVFCIYRGAGSRIRWLVEQRPSTGRWAAMWQFPTRAAPAPTRGYDRIATIRHALTHREYMFTVVLRRVPATALRTLPTDKSRPARWADAAELDRLPMSRPQLQALAAARHALMPASRAAPLSAIAVPAGC